MRLRFASGFLTGLLLFTLTASAASTPEQIFVQASPSVVVIDIFDAQGKSIGQGSGVVIDTGQVITNCHVAQKGKSLQVRQSGKTFKATLQFADPDRDLCQLSVPNLQATPITLGTAKKLTVGQRVYAIGAPKGLGLTLSEGLVSSLRPYEGSQYIQTSAAISPGSSGGGLFDNQGRLIGITTFYLEEGQNLNFALPVDWISELPQRAQAAIAVGLALGSPAYGQSLQEAVKQTLQTNPDILIDASKRLSTDEALRGARGGYLPKVDLGLGTGRERSNNSSTLGSEGKLTRREASLTLTQMLFDGFGVASEVSRNRARVESAAHKVAGTSEQVGLQAVEAYLEVLRQRELVALTRENLAAHERTHDQIKIRSEGGVGRKTDLEQIRARLGLAKANFTAAEANLRDAETNFLRVVGASPADLSKPNQAEHGLLPGSMDEAVQMAFDNNPTLKSAMADVEAADAQNNAAKSFMYPRFDLELGTAQNSNLNGVKGGNDERYAMLRMRYNLFKGGSGNARVNETAQLANEAREIMRRTRQQLEQSTRLSWNAKVSASERLPSLKQYADSSLATRDAYTKQFSIGQKTLLDMLDSENEYFTAGSDYVSGQYVELFAHYRVLADVGQLLGVLGVASREEAMIEAKK